MAPTEEMNLVDFDRSNKGASKQRRDQINAEIVTMRDLLPLTESARQRLSQLQIMSLTCVYIRKCNILQKLFRSKCQDSQLPDNMDFFQALTGFLLVITREGKLLYISENVTEFLGHSMVDMKTQGDSLYDIVDKRDQRDVQAHLLQGGSPNGKEPRDISFFCRMNMSRTLKRQSGFGDVKVMHVRGHYIQGNTSEANCPGDTQSIFMATCSPLITPDLKENLLQNNTMVFKTVHHLDMTFMEVTKTAEYHLGCSIDELNKRSWYSLLHPEDIHEAKEKHVQLIRSSHEMGCMMTVRMLKADGSLLWVNTVMHVRQASIAQDDEPLIVCINQVIDSSEAYQIKMRGHMFSMYPGPAHELWSSQLPTAATQDIPVGPWVQQNGPHLMPMSTYQADFPGYIGQPGCVPMYHMQCPPGVPMSRGNKHVVSMPTFNAVNMAQSDKLKAMLKRKIQGPQTGSCRPSKITKPSWDTQDKNKGLGFSDIDQSMPLMEPYIQMPVPVCVASQGQTTQVIQRGNYRLGVLTAKNPHEVLNCNGMPIPSLTKTEIMVQEQVVPDVNVPDSFLTPDPSPISSPEPAKIIVKNETMDPEDTTTTHFKSSISIIQALEKLASIPRQLRTEAPASVVRPMQPVPTRRKELPIFDAFDIDNFFDALHMPEVNPKVSIKMENAKLECHIKKEVLEQPPCPTNIPNFIALKEENCLSPCFVPKKQQSNSLSCIQSPMQQSIYMRSVTQMSNNPSPSAPDSVAKTNKTNSPSSNSKDPVVTSVMVSSPHSVTSSPNEFDDLLSCFSDDELDLSPLQMDPRSKIFETSVSEDLFFDHIEKSNMSFHKDLQCGTPIHNCTQRSPEELSPQSSSSPLAGEDELVENASAFTMAMALDALDSQEDVCHSSIKVQDVLGMTDEHNFILDAF